MGLMEEDVLAALGFMLLYLQDVIKTEIAHINYVHQNGCRKSFDFRYILIASS